MSSDKTAGSFFNKVPDDNSNNDNFDESLSDALKKRKSKPLASSPSTKGGKPLKAEKQYIEVGSSSPADQSYKSQNNINNPEYDDQGFTLYTNEKTGEKKRVFEALVKYPCLFTIKIVGANEGTFVSEIIQIVAETCDAKAESISFSERKNGKWISVTVEAPVKSAEMLYMLYENIDRDPRVKFKF